MNTIAPAKAGALNSVRFEQLPGSSGAPQVRPGPTLQTAAYPIPDLFTSFIHAADKIDTAVWSGNIQLITKAAYTYLYYAKRFFEESNQNIPQDCAAHLRDQASALLYLLDKFKNIPDSEISAIESPGLAHLISSFVVNIGDNLEIQNAIQELRIRFSRIVIQKLAPTF